MNFIDFPFHSDGRGRTAKTSYEDHVRDMIEQIIFTSPGERVNRPDFGSGLLQAVFAPNSDELAATTNFLIQGALQQYMGNLIRVDGVDVNNRDAILEVTVKYTILRTQEQKTDSFKNEGL